MTSTKHPEKRITFKFKSMGMDGFLKLTFWGILVYWLVAYEPATNLPRSVAAKQAAQKQEQLSTPPSTPAAKTVAVKQKKEAVKAIFITAEEKADSVYIERFQKVAINEMNRYNIPASISMAQGLLESDAGRSILTTRSNNHFGIKCYSKKCSPGHCSNYKDDSHKDFFINYENAWTSWRDHSLLLKKSTRYQKLFKLKKTDYKGWAKGLKAAGYATDPKYAEKLIAIIKRYKLDELDKGNQIVR